MASIAEYFLLRDASATAARIPDQDRKEIADALTIGRQKAEAAEALWSNGHAAEGLRLSVEALLVTLEAAPRYGRVVAAPTAASAPVLQPEPAKTEAEAEQGAPAAEADETAAPAEIAAAPAKAADADRVAGQSPPASGWREALVQRGIAKDKLQLVEEAEKKAREAALPKLDADVSPAHSDLYHLMTRARAEVDRALAYAAMSRRELTWTKITRIATASVLGVLVVVALFFVLRTPTAITAEASETFGNSPNFQPQNVVDDNPSTEWLLGDRQTGWVEARLSPPRRVARVVLTNARNAPHFDRATREYRLEFYSGGRMVRSIDGEFATYEREPAPVTVEAGVDNVERVRFVVRSFHHLGGGLAEMHIEE